MPMRPIMDSIMKPIMFPMQGDNVQGLPGFDFKTGRNYGLRLANPVIGMKGVGSFEYAEHSLTEIQANPVNLLRHPNKFDEANWIKNDGATVTQINATDWEYTEGNAAASLQQTRDVGVDGWEGKQSFIILKGGTAVWLRLTVFNASDAIRAWFRVDTGQLGTGSASGTGSITNWNIVDLGDSWEIEVIGVASTLSSSLGYIILTADGDGSNTRDVPGTTFLFRDALASVPEASYQETESIGALDNWFTTLTENETFGLAYEKGQTWYRLDAQSATVTTNRYALGDNGVSNIPITLKIRCWGSGNVVLRPGSNGSYPTLPITLTDTPTEYTLTSASAGPGAGVWVVEAEAGALCYFDGVDMAEGQKVFGVGGNGAAVYLLRTQAGVGALYEPDIENKCLNYSIAPVDTTGITDGAGVTTTAVDRASLPSSLLDALDLEDPDGTVTAMYRSQGSGTVYATGPTGNQNEHFVRGLIWGEAGTAAAVVGLENNAIAPLSSVEVLEWVGGKGTPLANTDRWSLAVVAGDVYWIANMMHEGNRERSHIPVAGSVRIKAKDVPVNPSDLLGVDFGQNHNKQTSTQGAVVGGAFPDNWNAISGIGPLWSVAEIGPDYIDARISGTSSGGIVSLIPSQVTDTVAAPGQTWNSTKDLALQDGDLTNITDIALRVEGRQSDGTFVESSTLFVQDIISGTQRTFSVFRTMSGGLTLRSNAKIDVVTVAGPIDVTFRIWCGEGSSWALQRSTEIVRRPLTTGDAILNKQFVGGMTVDVKMGEISDPVNLASMFVLATSADNNIEMRMGTSPNQRKPRLKVEKDAVTTSLISTVDASLSGFTFRAAFKEGAQTIWLDGVEEATDTASLPGYLPSFALGDNASVDRNIDGVMERLTIRNGMVSP